MTRAVLVALALAVLAGPVAAQVPDDTLIVPGVRIGRWTLEMTIAELEQANGKAASSPANAPGLVKGLTTFFWPPINLAAVSADRRRVESLLVYETARFRTDKNVAVGSSRAVVVALYGDPTATVDAGQGEVRLIYDPLGLGFLFSDGNSVVNVYVFRPDAGRNIWVF